MNSQAGQASWLDLSGRVCVVSGAAGGIGATLAEGFSRAGCKVALLDRDMEGGENVATRIRESGGHAAAIRCDISDPESVVNAAAECERTLGACDVLVNNAATMHVGSLLETPLSKWNRVMSVNLTGYFLCSQVFGKAMAACGRGSIVHVASVGGYYPQPSGGAYSVSKAGVLMLSQCLAVELGGHGVRSNVVSPAMVRTQFSEPLYSDPELLHAREQIVPSRRIGSPNDILETILFLASDRASYVNGQELLVDGGVSRAFLGLLPRPRADKKAA